MAIAMRECVGELSQAWRKLGHRLGFGVGIAQGYATLGRVGFPGRYDYAAVGTVTNLAARLCDAAGDGQILVSERVHAAVQGLVRETEVQELSLKGFSRTLSAHNIVGLNEAGSLV
jgi:adenylate cyclase